MAQLTPSVTNPTISDVYDKIQSGRLNLQPDFQRRFVWTLKHQEEFIGTILEGYPFPEIYVCTGEYNFENIVEISAQKNVGIEDMEEKIYSFIVDEKVEDSSEKLIITNVRHKTALEKTKDAIRNIFETIDMGLPMDLISVDLKEALDSLSEITGEISSASYLTFKSLV